MLDKEDLKYSEYVRMQEFKVNEVQKLHNIVFLVNTGAIVFSVNYISNLDGKVVQLSSILIYSWILMILSLIWIIIARRCAILYATEMSLVIQHWFGKAEFLEKGMNGRAGKFSRRIDKFDDLSLLFLISGIIALVVFCATNFLKNP